MKEAQGKTARKPIVRPIGRVCVLVEGLSLEKLITRAAAEHIRLTEVERIDARSLRATLRGADLVRLRNIAESIGWRVTVQRESVLRRSQGLLTRRVMLALGLLVFIAGVWAANACVWFVRIEGAGESIGEVRVVLAEHDVRPGRWRAALDLQAVQRALEKRLPRIAWVDVHMQGVTVIVECVPARVPQPAQYGGEFSDIVASRDGIIRSMKVYAGTAKVKAGDAVQRGQVLVSGEERTADGGMRQVPAQAEVLSRVWYSAKARIPAMQNDALPTGNVYERVLLCTPWYRWSNDPPSDFVEQDIDIRRQEIGGVFVPIWAQIESYAEVTVSRSPRDRAELEAESATIAERLAREKLPFDAQILDKWVEYSMMKDEHFSAEVILETVEDIAQSSAASGTGV